MINSGHALTPAWSIRLKVVEANNRSPTIQQFLCFKRKPFDDNCSALKWTNNKTHYSNTSSTQQPSKMIHFYSPTLLTVKMELQTPTSYRNQDHFLQTAYFETTGFVSLSNNHWSSVVKFYLKMYRDNSHWTVHFTEFCFLSHFIMSKQMMERTTQLNPVSATISVK